MVAALALAVAGVVAIGCGDQGPGEGESDGDLGRIELAVQTAPADGRCLRLTVDHPSTMLKVVRTIALTPNTASQTAVSGLPVGFVGLVGEVFNVACASVTASSPLTWVSDRQTVTIAPDLTQTVTLILRRAGKVNVGIDFVANAQIEEIKLSLPPLKIASAPTGTMVFTQQSSNAVWRVSTAFDLTSLSTLSSQPRLITSAPDGSILVTTNNDTAVQVLGRGGVGHRATLTLPFTAGDIVVDPAGFGWVGATNASQIIRISNIQTVASPTMLAIAMPISTTPALAVGPDTGVRVGGGVPGGIVRLTSTGGVVRTTPVPATPRGLVVPANDSFWFVSRSSGNNVWKGTETSTAQAVFQMSPVPTEVAIVNTTKGVLVALSSGGLLLGRPDGTTTTIMLPNNAIATSLAVSVADGRVWATDTAGRRLLVVTLP